MAAFGRPPVLYTMHQAEQRNAPRTSHTMQYVMHIIALQEAMQETMHGGLRRPTIIHVQALLSTPLPLKARYAAVRGVRDWSPLANTAYSGKGDF